MLRQPMSRFTQMQATDIDIRRNEVRKTKEEIVSSLTCNRLPMYKAAEVPLLHGWLLTEVFLQIRILSICTGNAAEKLEKDISRPRYFDPYDAIKYGIIDKVQHSTSDCMYARSAKQGFTLTIYEFCIPPALHRISCILSISWLLHCRWCALCTHVHGKTVSFWRFCNAVRCGRFWSQTARSSARWPRQPQAADKLVTMEIGSSLMQHAINLLTI